MISMSLMQWLMKPVRRMNPHPVGVRVRLTTNRVAVEGVDAIAAGVVGAAATAAVEIVTIGNRQTLRRKVLEKTRVEDQSLRTKNAQETAPMIVAVAAMARDHRDHSDQIVLNTQIELNAKKVKSVLSRYQEKKTKRPSSSYLN